MTQTGTAPYRAEGGNIARRAGDADERFREFANGVDYLLHRVIDNTDPEISRIRARLYIAFVVTKDLFADSSKKARAAAKTTDGWVREHPWQSIGIAAFAGALIGVHANRQRAP